MRRRFMGRVALFALRGAHHPGVLAALLVWALGHAARHRRRGPWSAALVVLVPLLLVGRAAGARLARLGRADRRHDGRRQPRRDGRLRRARARGRTARPATPGACLQCHERAPGERTRRERRQLLADVSHELRTPLSVIQGNVEGILDGLYPADRAHLEPILEETQLLERLVEDLRTLSLSETGCPAAAS